MTMEKAHEELCRIVEREYRKEEDMTNSPFRKPKDIYEYIINMRGSAYMNVNKFSPDQSIPIRIDGRDGCISIVKRTKNSLAVALMFDISEQNKAIRKANGENFSDYLENVEVNHKANPLIRRNNNSPYTIPEVRASPYL